MSLAYVIMEGNWISESEIHNLRSVDEEYYLCYSQDYSISQDIVHKQFEEDVANTGPRDTWSWRPWWPRCFNTIINRSIPAGGTDNNPIDVLDSI
jgi:hypothetical protein